MFLMSSWTTVAPGMKHEQLIAEPGYDEATDIGAALRNPWVEERVARFPYVARIKFRRQEYLDKTGTIRTGHKVIITLAESPEDIRGGGTLRFEIWNDGQNMTLPVEIDLDVVAQLGPITVVNGWANARLRVLEVREGEIRPGITLVACFRMTDLVRNAPPDSLWMIGLGKPFREDTETGEEFRRVTAGAATESAGMILITEQELEELREFTKKPAKSR